VAGNLSKAKGQIDWPLMVYSASNWVGLKPTTIRKKIFEADGIGTVFVLPGRY